MYFIFTNTAKSKNTYEIHEIQNDQFLNTYKIHWNLIMLLLIKHKYIQNTYAIHAIYIENTLLQINTYYYKIHVKYISGQIHEKYMRNTWDIHEQIHMKYMRNT